MNIFERMDNSCMEVRRLLWSNQNIGKLLLYPDNNPLEQPDIPIKELSQKLQNLIVSCKDYPKPDDEKQENLEYARIIFYPINGARWSGDKGDNFMKYDLIFEIIIPKSLWYINGYNQRIFTIMSEIQDVLYNNKTISLTSQDISFRRLPIASNYYDGYGVTYSNVKFK